MNMNGLKGFLVAVAVATVVGETSAALRVGVINWDCSVPSETWFGGYQTRSLSPARYRYLTPYYADVLSPDKISYHRRTAEEYDRELQYAIDAGIDYMAYCWYGEDASVPRLHIVGGGAASCEDHLPEITWARQLHAKSALRDRLGMCAIIVGCHYYTDGEIENLARAMKEPWYEKVEGRPLCYFFYGNVSNIIERTRATAQRLGAGDPYVVSMYGAPGGNIRIDALSAYAPPAPPKDGAFLRYPDFFRAILKANEDRAATGRDLIPAFSTGRDHWPRIERPVPWCQNPPMRYASPATERELVDAAKEFVGWIDAHKNRCPAGHVLTFAWNEFEEGGFICPTWSPNGPDTSRLEAFAKVVRIFKGEKNVTAKPDDPLPALADLRKRILELYLGVEKGEACKRFTEKLETAERLFSTPGSSRAELDALRVELKAAVEEREAQTGAAIVNVFAASGFHRERVAKRIEIARRLKRPEFADHAMRDADLKGFRQYVAEELAFWKEYPGNPGVRPAVLSVKDFGAVGDGMTANDEAFVRAVAAVAALGGRPAVLKIPAGEYYFEGKRNGVAHVDFSSLTNCVVTGEGPENTRFLFGESDCIGVRFDECCNSTFAGVEMYWKTCPFSQGVVEKVDKTTSPHTLVIRHVEGTKRPDDPHYKQVKRAQVCATFDAAGHQVLGAPLFYDITDPVPAEDLGGGRFRIKLDPKHKWSYSEMNVKEGMTVVLPDRVNNTTAVRSRRSRFCNFDSVWIRNSPEAGFTVSGQFITAWKCRIFPLAPHLRLSTNADAIFNSPGTFLGHCEFRNMNDDGGNCHYHGVELASADPATRTLRFAQHGISKFDPGEPVQIYRAKTGELIATLHVERATVVSAPGGRRCEVTVAEALPEGLKSKDALGLGEMTDAQRYALSHGVGEKPKEFADVVYAPHGLGLGYVVTGCTFADFRGIAINTQCPNSLIENNVIEYCNHGLQISSLMMWYEGLPCYNLVVRGNSFAHTMRGVTGYLSTVDSGPCHTDYIQGVLLEGNAYDSVVFPVRFRNFRDVEVLDAVTPDLVGK